MTIDGIQALVNLTVLLTMVLLTAAVQKNIVKNYEDKPPKAVLKYVIDENLEHCWCVLQPEWHDKKLVTARMHLECCFL